MDTPLILSLVYNRGTILASKRTPYEDLIQAGFDEKVLAERLQKQHKLICAAVRTGRIDDLVKMTAKEAANKRGAAAPAPVKVSPPPPPNGHTAAPVSTAPPIVTAPAPVAAPVAVPAQIQTAPVVRAESPAPAVAKPQADFKAPANAPIPQPNEELVWDLPLQIIEDELVIETVDVVNPVGNDTILLDDAIQFVEPIPSFEGKLEIEFATKTTFKAGERKTLQICVHRGDPTKRIVGAQVVVKVLGSSFRPLIFHARTDAAGLAVVHLQIPQFRSGRAALLVRALDRGEEAELRQIVRQS